MNLLKSIQSHPALHGMAGMIVAVAAFAGATFAFGPERPTYTAESPADHITFNSITNNSFVGDERNFMVARDATVTGNGSWQDNVNVEAGKEYLVRMYVHNNAASNLNLIATNTRATVALQGSTGTKVGMTGYVSADNATPKQVYDNVYFESAKNFNMVYVAGSAKIYNNATGDAGRTVSDAIMNGDGTQIGYDKNDGNFPGCYEYASYITFKVKPQFAPTTDFTVEKSVRKSGDTSWQQSVAANPGDTVQYRIKYANTSTVQMNNVMAMDKLPAGVTYVNGSTKLYISSDPYTARPLGDGVAAGGINIGNYAGGAMALVIFDAKVAANDALATCGVNTLINIASIESDYGQKSDDAVVTVTKTCDTTPTDKDVTVCEITTKNIVTIKESVYNANKSAYTDKDSDLCKEAPAPVDKDVTVCNIKTGIVQTIKESVYNANKDMYADKNSDSCKVVVCEISSKSVITISKEQQAAHPELYEAKDGKTCKAAAIVTPVTPTTPVAELPRTGFALNALSLTGAGALSYAGYAYIASRRSL